ncbi:MAG: hypothetical protein AAF842_03525 [Planctomycetota bacterium]
MALAQFHQVAHADGRDPTAGKSSRIALQERRFVRYPYTDRVTAALRRREADVSGGGQDPMQKIYVSLIVAVVLAACVFAVQN